MQRMRRGGINKETENRERMRERETKTERKEADTKRVKETHK
jgi:hypothetical protein